MSTGTGLQADPNIHGEPLAGVHNLVIDKAAMSAHVMKLAHLEART